MKNLILHLIIIISVTTVNFAQQDCLPCSATLTLDANSLLTDLVPHGIAQQRSSDNDVSVFGHSSLWMGATDPAGNFKFAGEIPEKEGSDFYPGPLDIETGLTDFETCKNWDRFFVMTREIVCEQDRLYKKYVVGQGVRIPDDSISIYLKSWPATGNPYFEDMMGFKLPHNGKPFATFWDSHPDGAFDGIYDPGNGDFPNIWFYSDCYPWNREEALARVPDEFAYWVFNDAGGVHSNSQTAHLNIEVQAMAFANDTEDIIGQSIVHLYKIINFGQEGLKNASLGLNLNPALGCSEDDFFGIEPDRNLFYSYNEDSSDGKGDCTCEDGESSWCEEIPMHGIKLLDRPYSLRTLDVTADGDTILVDPISPEFVDTFVYQDITHLNYYNACTTSVGLNCLPQQQEEYHELMKGHFSDGTAVTYGGIGYNVGSVDSMDFVFPYSPDSSDWSMCSSPQQDKDYRPLMTIGPSSYFPKQTIGFSFVSFFVEDVDHPCPSLDLLQNADEALQEYRDNCYVIERDEKLTTAATVNTETGGEFEVYPNPFNDLLILKSEEQLNTVKIFDSIGRLVLEASEKELLTSTISTTQLNRGVFYVRVNNENHLYKLIKTE